MMRPAAQLLPFIMCEQNYTLSHNHNHHHFLFNNRLVEIDTYTISGLILLTELTENCFIFRIYKQQIIESFITMKLSLSDNDDLTECT